MGGEKTANLQRPKNTSAVVGEALFNSAKGHAFFKNRLFENDLIKEAPLMKIHVEYQQLFSANAGDSESV